MGYRRVGCSLKRNHARSRCDRPGDDKVAFILFYIRGWKKRVKSDRCATTSCRLGGPNLCGKSRQLSLAVATSEGCDVCAIIWVLRGRAVAEVDAFVEGYQESIGIQLPDDTSRAGVIYFVGESDVEHE